MIGYTCKYTPVELLYALGGGKAELLNDEAEDFEYAEGLTHPNLCSHAKALLEHSRAVDELILVNCCDSIRRVYDVLKSQGHHKFLFLFDLPHDDGDCARRQVKRELLRLAGFYGEQHSSSFNKQLFFEACRASTDPVPDKPFLAVMGARVSHRLLLSMQEKAQYPVIDLTCGGNRRLEPLPSHAETLDFMALIDWYAAALLQLVPCMRMTNVERRRILWENENLRGIIYNTVKFCDYYGFDYARLKKETALPILKIESDFTSQSAGQLSTRLEAFAESLNARYDKFPRIKNRQKRLFAGIDSGSTTTKMVVLDQSANVVASSIIRTGAKTQKSAQAALEEVCKQLGIDQDSFAAIVATGYGRNNIVFATDTKTEITCHAKGAYFLNSDIRTIVDIGGQDSKVICLDKNGAVANFIMNDKCAAGTGRFLEVMAQTLELELVDMSTAGLTWKHDLTISSMCTVFAESEVISLIADNHSTADIIHGLNKSVATKTASMVSRAGGQAPYMMTGGVARNIGIVRELEKKLGAPLFITEAPDLCGALGAALFALE